MAKNMKESIHQNIAIIIFQCMIKKKAKQEIFEINKIVIKEIKKP